MKVKINNTIKEIQSLHFLEPNILKLIDQRKLPFKLVYYKARTLEEVCYAISEMVVRGAPLIGITGAYGFVITAINFKGKEFKEFQNYLMKAKNQLLATRPTAVDLRNNLEILSGLLDEKLTIEENINRLVDKTKELKQTIIDECETIGNYGNNLITPAIKTIMTICNAGALATIDIGTALAPMRRAKQDMKDFTVLVPETRPRMQGARLTAWELYNEDIKHHIITDNSVGYFFANNLVDLVIVGADRIVKNGDIANKIGTYTLSVLCKEHKVPFYVAAPMSTFDFTTATGNEINIEQRSQDEVRKALTFDEKSSKIDYRIIHNPESPNYNIAFDITPSKNITGIISPKGIIEPTSEAINKLKNHK